MLILIECWQVKSFIERLNCEERNVWQNWAAKNTDNEWGMGPDIRDLKQGGKYVGIFLHLGGNMSTFFPILGEKCRNFSLIWEKNVDIFPNLKEICRNVSPFCVGASS
jgi:hypothetical protein